MNPIGWPSPTVGPMTWPGPSQRAMDKEWRKRMAKRIKRLGAIIFYSWLFSIVTFGIIGQKESVKIKPQSTIEEQIKRLVNK